MPQPQPEKKKAPAKSSSKASAAPARKPAGAAKPMAKSVTVAVPNEVGKTLSAATSDLSALGLSVSSKGTGRTVSSQSPDAGATVNVGSTITLTLGSSM